MTGLLGRVGALIDPVSRGSWLRPALGVVGGVVFAVVIYRTHHPSRAGDAFGLAVIVALGWFAGIGWERSAAQTRRISDMRKALSERGKTDARNDS